MAYLDKAGVIHLWSKIKDALNGKANSNHTHNYSELTNKPTIPTIPSKLPADGGNADTVDGIHIVVSREIPTDPDQSIITFVI